MKTLQEQIDSLAYPPTHTYKLDGLKPNYLLEKRVAILDEVCPELFAGERFLDVGANKGYFMLRAATVCKHVVAIETSAECCELLSRLRPSNTEVLNVSFREFETDESFDRIFIGNGPHYMFRDAGGWKWVKQLAGLSSGIVVMEGPLGMECADMAQCIPDNLKPLYRSDVFCAVMASHFDWLITVPSVSPDRYVTVFKRRKNRFSEDALNIGEHYRVVYRIMSRYLHPDYRVIEVCARESDRGVISREIIPHISFATVDKDPERGDLVRDVLTDTLPECDVVVSTGIFHHVEDHETLFANLTKNCKRFLMVSGPNAEVLEPFGDHARHLRVDEMKALAKPPWRLIHHERVGLSVPLPELLFVYEKQ